MILGDNIFFGHGLVDMLNSAAARNTGATVFANWVAEPERYGVIKMDADGTPLEVIEKPKEPVSNWAVTGLYFFDGRASDIAAEVKPSARGELEIVDIINTYLAEGALSVERLGRGFAWLDTGTPQTLLQAASFVQTLEERQGLKISCVEEIAYRKGFIGIDDLKKLAADLKGNAYAQYLEKVIRGTD